MYVCLRGRGICIGIEILNFNVLDRWRCVQLRHIAVADSQHSALHLFED